MNFRIFFNFTVGLLCLAVAGCGGGGTNNNNTKLVISQSSVLLNRLTMTLSEDKALTTVGSTVIFAATITNNSTIPITFSAFTNETSPPFTLHAISTFAVIDSKGTVIDPTGNPMQFVSTPPPPDPVITLGPGQSVGVSVPYTFIKPGVYTAEIGGEFPLLGSSATTYDSLTVQVI